MASAAQEKLFEIFAQVAGEQVSSLTSVVDSSQQLAGSLSEVVKQINLTKSSAGPPAAAPVQSSSQHSDTGSNGPLGVVEDIASSVFRNALGAMPLVHGILSLFGGGDSKPPEPQMLKYVAPPSIAFQAAETGTGFSAVDFDQMGQARTFGDRTIQARMPVPPETTQAGTAVPPSGQQITVHVQAMDARSFLDRSSEIAAAVRNAMLNLSSINDVVNDL